MPTPCYASLDQALDGLAGYGPGLANGNFNHAPMVVEALCALGRPDTVPSWLERYRSRMLPRPVDGNPIEPRVWRSALGQRDRFAAWSNHFAKELAQMPWPQALDLWTGRLAPGVAAAATHGVIRVGHAVRALNARETPQRRRELADALASWATTYFELRGDIGSGGTVTPREALARIAIVPAERRPSGNITEALKGLRGTPGIAQTIAMIDLSGDIDALLATLTELFARVYLANVTNTLSAIVFIHGVTSLTALGHIAPHVSDTTARSLLRYGWLTGCGLYACYGGRGLAAAATAETSNNDILIARAVAHGDEHVIKFTEACLTRNRLSPSPIYPAAIGHVLEAIPRH